MAKRSTAKNPKAHPTNGPLVFSTKVMRFDTQPEAELAKANDRGQRAYVLPPVAAWAGKTEPC
jgi:hypothetical protein